MKRWWPVAVAGLLVGAVALGQRARGGLLSWNGQPITPSSVTTNALTVNGDAGIAGNTSLGGTLGVSGMATFANVDAGNVTVTGKLCSTVSCSTNYAQNDGFGNLLLKGSVLGDNNWATAGNVSGDYLIHSSGIKNTGTAAACSSNTGAVCVNDTGGLAVADGSGTTVATISAAGKASVATVAVTASTDLFQVTLAADGTGTHTVRASAICTCMDTTRAVVITYSISTTTLSIAGGGNGDTVNCFCPTSS